MVSELGPGPVRKRTRPRKRPRHLMQKIMHQDKRTNMSKQQQRVYIILGSNLNSPEQQSKIGDKSD